MPRILASISAGSKGRSGPPRALRHSWLTWLPSASSQVTRVGRSFGQSSSGAQAPSVTFSRKAEIAGSVKVEAVLTMDDPNTALRVQSTVHSEAAYTKDATKARSVGNQGVVVYAGLLDAMEKAEEAIQGLDIERFQQARNMFDGRYEDARRHAVESRDQQLLNQAFLLRHFMAELSAVGESDLLHDHRAARDQLKKDADYRRYLLQHHRRRH